MRQWIVALAAVVVLTGCTPKVPAPLAATISSDGKTANLVVGQKLTVTLPTEAGTGYIWSAVTNPAASILSDTTVSTAATPTAATDTSIVGGGADQVWTYTAAGVGTTSIVYNYTRPWEANAAPNKVYTLHVIVTAK